MIAGDLNLDASQSDVAADISQAMFLNPSNGKHLRTTTRRAIFNSGRAIDSLFTRGPLRVAQPVVHRTIRASDRYPLSVTVDLF